MNTDIIHDDIDFEKEDNDKDPEGTKEEKEDFEERDEEGYEDDEADEEEDEEDKQGDGEGYEEAQKSTYNNNNIIVKNKYTKPSHSIGVDDIQKLPLNWFQNVRQNYKQNNIIPRKKEVTISEEAFRDVKKKI